MITTLCRRGLVPILLASIPALAETLIYRFEPAGPGNTSAPGQITGAGTSTATPVTAAGLPGLGGPTCTTGAFCAGDARVNQGGTSIGPGYLQFTVQSLTAALLHMVSLNFRYGTYQSGPNRQGRLHVQAATSLDNYTAYTTIGTTPVFGANNISTSFAIAGLGPLIPDAADVRFRVLPQHIGNGGQLRAFIDDVTLTYDAPTLTAEPSSFILMSIGCFTACAYARRRRKTPASGYQTPGSST